jgi:anti-sigma factor RsiW
MTWTCEQTEARLSDYIDGLLQPGERSAFDAHVRTCPICAPLVASVSELVGNLHAMDELDEPPRLVYAILDKTLGPRDTAKGWRAVLGWFGNLASPRFAYGAISMVATFLILATASGFSWRKPKLADLQPATMVRNADRQAHLIYARGTKFVSDLRVVYEIQSRLRQDNELPTAPEEALPQSAPSNNNKEPGRTDGTNPTSPKQQNRANGLGRHLEILAAWTVSQTHLLETPVVAAFHDPRRMR